ncbi:bleomycin hydrolase [Conglomerata obtusa]
MLDWRDICTFDKDIEPCEKGLVALYTFLNDEYTIHHSFSQDLSSCLNSLLKKRKAGANAGDLVMYDTKSEDKIDYSSIILASTGPDSSVEDIRKAAAFSIKKSKECKIYDITISTQYEPLELAVGSVLSNYEYTVLKKRKGNAIKIQAFEKNSDFERGKKIAFYHNFARFLSDTPANLMTPSIFVEYARDVLKELKNVEVQVYDQNYLEKNNMNLFLSVSNGSEEPPKFLVIKYKGRESTKNVDDANNAFGVDLSLVGKGITFDSGGISIKPSNGMSDMKADMMGGATVLAATALAAFLGKKINITTSIALSENLPSGKATKPGDVKIGMSGISVEIDNTDAEGRLVLGDALVHAQKENPKYLIDVATLTGAICVALGNVYLGFFCTDNEFANLISESGNKTDDLIWRMPLHKKYKELMESNVADMKNAGGSYGGSCTAAIFLNEFIDAERKWAHFDIAGALKTTYNKELYGKGFNGKPVRLLFEIIERIEKEHE